ncbi:MAG: hypothetical protein JSU04_01120 [Bdellovibrionales bacterium]|nr:hypothetical protein [Bdellovibrionales bacterium]
MREAIYWDLLTTFHLIVILVFLLIFGLEILFIRKAFAKRKIPLMGASLFLILVTIFAALIARGSMFPGGGLYDTFYDADRFRIMNIQEHLEAHREACKSYPTSEQGLDRLTCDLKKVGCPDFVPMSSSMMENVKYKSDGQTYEIETTRDYGIPNLLIKAKNGARPRLYIRTTNGT